MFGLQKYNYGNFTKALLMKEVLPDRLGGPQAGERAPQFTARTLDGGEVALRDYEGKSNVVLTFGSATCPFTAASIGGMNRLSEDYGGREVKFLFVYVREAHPGERLPAHNSMEDKLYAAEVLRREENLVTPILVDGLRGGIHRKYGELPNATYIIDKSGRVAFRCLWTRPRVLKDALEELLQRQQERDVEHAIVGSGEHRAMPATYAMLHAHRALERGGHQAIHDFRREMGVPGRVAVTASRAWQPVANHPGRSAAAIGATAAVLAGGILLGRQLRQRRVSAHSPNGTNRAGTPFGGNWGDHPDSEAVRI
jgi:hypothetical protein